jgi:hypothetical protein
MLNVTDYPDLVGATAAAEILGVKPPAISKLRAAGRLPMAIPVARSNSVYRRADIEALASELAAERTAKENDDGSDG